MVRPNQRKASCRSAPTSERCETEFFRCQWYKGETLHIEFKRPDLIAKLNALAGGKTLKDE